MKRLFSVVLIAFVHGKLTEHMSKAFAASQ